MVAVARSGSIGQIRSVDATFTKLVSGGREMEGPDGGSISELASYPLLAIIKLLGLDFDEVRTESFKPEGSEVELFSRIDLHYPHAVASARTGIGVKAEGDLVVAGTQGYLYVPAPWWLTEYFETRFEHPHKNKKYYFKFDGDGLRYELAEFAWMIRNSVPESFKLRARESVAMAGIIEEANATPVIRLRRTHSEERATCPSVRLRRRSSDGSPCRGEVAEQALTTAYEGMMSMARLAVNAVTHFSSVGVPRCRQYVGLTRANSRSRVGPSKGQGLRGVPPTTKVEVAEGPRQAPIIVSQVRISHPPTSTGSRRIDLDYSGTAFVAHIDTAELVRTGAQQAVTGCSSGRGGGAFHRGWFKSMRGGGSATTCRAGRGRDVGPADMGATSWTGARGRVPCGWRAVGQHLGPCRRDRPRHSGRGTGFRVARERRRGGTAEVGVRSRGCAGVRRAARTGLVVGGRGQCGGR